MTRFNLLVTLIAGLTLGFPVMAKVYKWVDNNGTTHYGETIPPQYADKDHQVLNGAGRVIRSEEVMTPARRRAKSIEERKQRDAAAAILEKARRDETLINTYSSLKEIDLARNRNMQQINTRIYASNSLIKSAQGNLVALQAEAVQYAKVKKEVPASLIQDIKVSKNRLTKLQRDVQAPLAEKSALQARFAADKARYIELTGVK